MGSGGKLHPFLTATLDGYEWSTLDPGFFTPKSWYDKPLASATLVGVPPGGKSAELDPNPNFLLQSNSPPWCPKKRRHHVTHEWCNFFVEKTNLLLLCAIEPLFSGLLVHSLLAILTVLLSLISWKQMMAKSGGSYDLFSAIVQTVNY
jgi:hypothetical protein